MSLLLKIVTSAFLHVRSDHEEKIVHGQKAGDHYDFFLYRQFPLQIPVFWAFFR